MKFNKILALPALALALIGLGACTDEVKYTPAEPEANVEAYFSAATSSTVSLDNDQNQFMVPVYRTSKTGAQTIALSSTSTDNLFSVASAVTFADGADEALVPVDFDFSSLEANKDYSVTITIDDAATTPYGKRTQTFAVKYAPWSAWATMKGNGEYTLGVRWGGSDAVSVKTRKNLLDPAEVQYQVVGLFTNDFTIDVNTQTGEVSVPMQNIGEPSNGNPGYLCDSYYFYTKVINAENAGIDPDDFKGLSSFNQETGMLTLHMAYFYLTSDNRVGYWTPGYEFLQLPGYPDYSMYFANNGSVISEQGVESAVITIAKGSDINGFAFKLLPGYLTDEQVDKEAEKIKADEDAAIYYNSGDYQFSISEDGDQTLVAVTYDAMGEYINTQSYHFYYEVQQKDWNEGWNVLPEKLLYTDCMLFGKPESWEVEVQESEDYPGYYRIVKPYAEVMDPADLERGHYYIYIDATNPDQVYIEPSLTSVGYTYISEAYMMMNFGGSTPAQVAAAGMFGKWKDNTLTMPAKSFGIFGGFTQTGWKYAAMNAAETVVLKPVPAAGDDNEPGLGTQAATLATKAFISAGSNAMPVKAAKDGKFAKGSAKFQIL